MVFQLFVNCSEDDLEVIGRNINHMDQTETDLTKIAKIKAARFCAYRERTQKEVREKVHSYGLFGDDAELVVSELITEGFINEERFATSYAGGKFRLKKWGKLKIKQGLEQHGLTVYCVNKGLAAIDDEAYLITLKTLLEKKWDQLEVADVFIRRHQTARFLIGKGYEPDLIWEYLKNY